MDELFLAGIGTRVRLPLQGLRAIRAEQLIAIQQRLNQADPADLWQDTVAARIPMTKPLPIGSAPPDHPALQGRRAIRARHLISIQQRLNQADPADLWQDTQAEGHPNG